MQRLKGLAPGLGGEWSEDSATRETEGGHAELWAVCQLARAILSGLGTHIYCGYRRK